MTQSKDKITSQADIDEMSGTSGEKDQMPAPTFRLPSLKINGKNGGFWRTVLDENEDLKVGDDGKALLEEVKKPAGVILMVKKTFSQEDGSSQLFSNEGTNNSIFSIFQKRETAKGHSITLAFQGTATQVKEEFAEIKMTQVIYFLLLETDEIVRLKVKGMSLGKLFDYWKEFGPKEHTFQYETILGEKDQKNKFGSFVVNTFTKGKLITDLSDVKVAMDEVKEKTEAIIKYNQERAEEAEANREMGSEGTYKGKEIEIEAEDEPEDDEPEMTPAEKVKASNEARKLDLGKKEEEEIDVSKLPI